MLDVYSSLKDNFSPNTHRHYLFTPRHLTRWAMGVQRYDLQGQELLQVLCKVFCAQHSQLGSEPASDSALEPFLTVVAALSSALLNSVQAAEACRCMY